MDTTLLALGNVATVWKIQMQLIMMNITHVIVFALSQMSQVM